MAANLSSRCLIATTETKINKNLKIVRRQVISIQTIFIFLDFGISCRDFEVLPENICATRTRSKQSKHENIERITQSG